MVTGDPLTGEDARQWKRYRVMKHMGWNAWEYKYCPKNIIDQILVFMGTEEAYIKHKREENGSSG